MTDRWDEIQRVLFGFGLRPAGDAILLEGTEGNQNFRVPSDRGEFVVRRYGPAELDVARAELGFAEFLAGRGYPTPSPLRSLRDELLEPCGCHLAAVFPFVHGRTPAAFDPSLAQRIGSLLGGLHFLGAYWSGPLPVRDRLGLLRSIISQGDPRLSGWKHFSALVARFLAAHGDALVDCLPTLSAGPIHHDLHRGNVLVDDHHEVTVIDFGEINRSALVLDPLRACHYVAADAPGLRLPRDLTEALFDGYQAARPLADDEREMMPVLFDLVNLIDAAIFLADPPAHICDVDQSRSLQIYLANKGDVGGVFASLG